MVKNNVSVLVPAYNEEKIIENGIIEQYLYLKSLQKKSVIGSFEILICINGSNDRTEEISRRLSKKYPGVRYFSIKAKGFGIALTEGLKRAKMDIITFTDAEYEVQLDFLIQAVPLMKKYQVLNCSRYLTPQPHGSSFFRALFSHGFREFFRLMFKFKFSDIGASKVFRSDAVRELLPHFKRLDASWQIEALYYSLKYKLRVKDIPINIVIKRPASESKCEIFKDTWYFFSTCLRFGIKNYLGI